jgi:hypothetical protein
MPRQRNRLAVAMLTVTGALVSALPFASPAAAFCASTHIDFVPGNHGMSCWYSWGPEETWTVPANITKPKFMVRGADDAVGGDGGFISAKLSVEAGQILDFKMGGNGAASSVSRDGAPLLVAGGGDGVEPNYLGPDAEPFEVQAPGLTGGSGVGDGSVLVEWYDAREPFDLVDSLGYVIVDIFDSERTIFAHTGSVQEWTVPEDVDSVIFDLLGGEGKSGEPRGHILVGFEVTAGEIFDLSVGGHGEDTTLVRGASFDVAVAAGGDTERPNYLPWTASPAEEFWEGGGEESEPGNGYAIVHYWPSENSTDLPSVDQPSAAGHRIELEQSALEARQGSTPACIVPRLTNKTPRVARKVLRRSNCTLSDINRRPARKWRRGQIVSQSPRPGTVASANAGVVLVVGASP